MLLGFTLEECRKAVVSVVAVAAAALGLFLSIDPSFGQACIVLVGAAFGVVSVFATKNSTPDDLSKAAAQLQAAALAVVGFFIVVPTSTVGKIGVLVAALVSAWAVFSVPNAGRGAPGA